MCIEVVWSLLPLGESGKCRKSPERLLHAGHFGSRQSCLALCRNMVLYVTTWFVSCRRLLSRNMSFLGRDIVVFYWYWVATRAFLVVTEPHDSMS